ncbi:hypothetical protein [Prosthecobacter sp.]|uniref:hypothetical protein n=1 Tax=Prosthecobacter sp. TaxID=1965333 RepID=UPI001D50F0AE|nr:hypothetical protein [Prosthecobacter sp.]MCB1278347.1 hypothetical protein [Prosthecobacter sp.]
MAANEIRDTPGRLLLGWAVLLISLVLLAWRIHVRPTDYEWTEYPTALGDTQYYTALGKDDRYEPNLSFPGQEKGVYRRSTDPVTLDDATMLKIAQDKTGRHFVYQPAAAGDGSGLPVYLKSGENRYVEFGARKFYPPYEPKIVP